jgi:hypothetical protein
MAARLPEERKNWTRGTVAVDKFDEICCRGAFRL